MAFWLDMMMVELASYLAAVLVGQKVEHLAEKKVPSKAGKKASYLAETRDAMMALKRAAPTAVTMAIGMVA